MSDKVYIGHRAASISTPPAFDPISKVIIKIDANNAYVAGNDTGRTIEKTCPYGTQEMANNLLAQLSGYVYRPLTGEDTLMDPAAELGDAITMDGVYTVLAKTDIAFDAVMPSDISAPGQEEIESEYPYQTAEERIEYQLATVRSSITKTAEEIRLEVSNEIEGLSAFIDVQLDSITSQVTGLNGQVSTLTQTATSLQSQVKGLNGQVSNLTQEVDSITASVSDVQTGLSQTLRVAADGVTITNAAGSVLTIDGGQVNAESLNLTGVITFTDLSSSVQGDINEAINMASDAYDLAYDNQLPGYIRSTYISSTEIRSPTVVGGTIHGMDFFGNTFNIYPDDESEEEDPGSFNIYGNAGNAGLYHMLQIRYFWSSGAFVSIRSPAGAQIRFSGDIDFSAATVTGL